MGSVAAHGYLALHATGFARAKAAANRRAAAGKPSRKTSPAPPVISTYSNVSPSFQGIYQSNVVPADTTGAMGPDSYIETVNTSYAIYTRSSTQTGAQTVTPQDSGTLDALTGVSTSRFGYQLSDPQIMWDPTTQRFYYTAVYFQGVTMSSNGLAIGWSTTPDPQSAADFCQYVFPFPNGRLPDYPKLGDTGSLLLVGYNEFSSNGTTYDGSAIATLPKPGTGTTCADPSGVTVTLSDYLRNADGTLAATPVPANLVDHGESTGYVVANADLTNQSQYPAGAAFVTVYKVTANSSGDAVISAPIAVTVPRYSVPPNAPQAGSSYLLDTMDGRLEGAVAAVDPTQGGVEIWTAHTVAGPVGSGSVERWYEINPNGATATTRLVQVGTVSDPSLYVWNGVISSDRADNGSTANHGDDMAMSVSTSSSTTDPAIQFVSRVAGMPVGTTSALQNLVQSGGPNVDFSCATVCRWGDYSGAGPDPDATGGTVGRVWLANEYNLAGGSTSTASWRTWVFQVTPTASATPSYTLEFPSTSPTTVTAGVPTSMQVEISPAPTTDVAVTLSSTDPSVQLSPTQVTLTSSSPAASFTFTDDTAGDTSFTASTSAGSLLGATIVTQYVTVSTAASAPAAPRGLQASVRHKGIFLSWAASSGAAYYRIYRNTSGPATKDPSLLYGTSSNTSFKDTSLVSGTTYYYCVTAVSSAGGESGCSNEASATW